MPITGPPLLDDLTPYLEERREDISAWFAEQRERLPQPIYASVDVRDAGWKVGAVDANSFPAGFNNVSAAERPRVARLIATNLRRQHPDARHVHLYPESHTRNAGYIENVRTLRQLLTLEGFEVTVGSPLLGERRALDGLSGPLLIDEVTTDGHDSLRLADGRTPDVVLLNHDMTEGVLPGLEDVPVMPDPKMGWHRRRKSEHFAAADPIIADLAKRLDLDPWLFCPTWNSSREKCLAEEDCLVEIAAEVDDLIATIQRKYDAHGIEVDPTIYVKNEKGTYGLGLLTVTQGEDLLNLSNRKLHRLTYGKGGVDAEDFLIQEGVPTMLSIDGAPAEPVIYLSDSEAASWFYRVNPKADRFGNLNTPKGYLMTHEEVTAHPDGPQVMEHAQTWHALVAELASLGMAAEQQALQSETV